MQARNWRMGIGLLVVTVAPALHAQSWTWTRQQLQNSPPARVDHTMCLDLASRHVLLVGGFTGLNAATDTWEWDGVSWLRSPTAMPLTRYDAATAADFLNGRALLFGGRTGVGRSSDTFLWNGSNWSQAFPRSAPSPRSGHAMASDFMSGHIMLFGGSDTTGHLDDTWDWNGSIWTNLHPAQHPPARQYCTMAYHTATQTMMLFGGSDGQATFGDTWTWDGIMWNPVTTTTAPSPRARHAMAYDGRSGTVMLYGGSNNGTMLGDTWEWNGHTWTQRTPATAPTPRDLVAMATDPFGNIALFGGSSGGGETWTLGLLDHRALASPYGSGCGAPALNLYANSLPQLGQVQVSEIGNVPAGLAFMAIGLSNARLGGAPLPLPLDPFGMPACWLLQNVAVSMGLPCVNTGNGTAQFSLNVPNNAMLIGTEIYLQGSALAPGQNPAALITSNGLHLRVDTNAGTRTLVDDFTDPSRIDRARSSGDWSNGAAAGGEVGGDGQLGTFDLLAYLGNGVTDHGTVNGQHEYAMDTDQLSVPGSHTLSGQPITVTDGRFAFTDILVPSGVRLVFTGSHAPILSARGKFEINGFLDLRGGDTEYYQPGSTTTAGQPGGAGNVFAGAGGPGGDRCSGTGASPNHNGQNGQDCRVVANHAYAGSAVGTGGRGSSLFPASGLNSSCVFGTGFSPIKYLMMAAAGGGGGGLWSAAGSGSVIYNDIPDPGTGVPPRLSFMGPPAAGGHAVTLFPLPAGTRSSDHFLIGGAGGGGGGSQPLFQNNFLLQSMGWAPGCGGGGGGGALALIAGDSLLISQNAQVVVRGGSAGRNDTTVPVGAVQSAPAGGGSGGSALLLAGRVASIAGLIDARGGFGGYLNRMTTVAPPDGGRVEVGGGDGAPGCIRLEVPTTTNPSPSLLPMALPPANVNNVAWLTDRDAFVAAQSNWRYCGQDTPPIWDRYVLDVDVNGDGIADQVYTDDPGYTLPPGSQAQLFGPAVGRTLPIAIAFQGAVVDPVSSLPVTSSLGPWRDYVRSGAGSSLNLDAATGYRFSLLWNRSVVPNATVTRLELTIR